MAWTAITAGQTDAKSPIDQQLMDLVRTNDADHEVRILALEAGGGGSGSVDAAAIGTITSGLDLNLPVLRRKKFNFSQHLVLSEPNVDSPPTGFNPTGELNTIWIGYHDNVTGQTLTTGTQHFDGVRLNVPKNSILSFRLPKNCNYFNIAGSNASSLSDSITVTVDGRSVTTVGILDETLTARSDTYSQNFGVTLFGTAEFFVLPKAEAGKEHTITVENTDSASKNFEIEGIEIGFISYDGEYCIDRTVSMSPGTASIRGISANISGQDITFDESDGYGYTGAIVSDTAGAITALTHAEPVMTQARPELIDWEAGVTSLDVINADLFPSSGFIHCTTPWGFDFIASYTGKTVATPGLHTLDGVLFSSTPDINFTPRENTDGASGTARGDLNINLWATGGFTVDSSNNKVDFDVIVNGTLTVHTATIASGHYSNDLIDFNNAFKTALNTAKDLSSIGGEYFAEYSTDTQKWIIGVTGGSQVTQINFDFSTGASSANSIHTTLGFDTADITGATSYIGGNEVQAASCAVMQKGRFIGADSPLIKTNRVIVETDNDTKDDIENRLGFGFVLDYANNDQHVDIYPEEDTTGVAIHWVPRNTQGMISAQVDYGQQIFLIQADEEKQNSSTKAKIQTHFLSYPRGTKRISLTMRNQLEFSVSGGPNQILFLGLTQYHTRPAVEALTKSQSIVHALDIAPKQLFRTNYGDSGSAFYVPGSGDNVDAISLTGSWTHGTGTGWNGGRAVSSSLNDTADFTFTTVGDGGGFSLITRSHNAGCDKVGVYLVSGGTPSETNSLLMYGYLKYSSDQQDTSPMTVTGLPAGQYTVRFKLEQANSLEIYAFSVIDTVDPDPNKNLVSLLGNDDQGLTYPLNTIQRGFYLDDNDRIPTRLNRSGYNEGVVWTDCKDGTNQITDYDETNTIQNSVSYFGQYRTVSDNGSLFRSFFFCKSLCSFDASDGASAVTVTPKLDNRNITTTYSQRVQAKNGSVSSHESAFPLVFKDFFLLASSDMSDSTTFLVGDTRGFRVGMKVVVKNDVDGEPGETRFITTINLDTSIILNEAVTTFTNYTTANNASITYHGYHVLKSSITSGQFDMGSFAYEPMDLLSSKWASRVFPKTKLETRHVLFRNITTGDDLFYPIHSDGVPGNYFTSTFSLMNSGQAEWNQNLRNVTVSTSPCDVKITSTREVPNG